MTTENKGQYYMDQKPASFKDEGGKPWSQQYYDRLGNLGWRFATDNRSGRIGSTFVAANDTEAPKLLDSWRIKGNPVEISIVIVPPNGNLTDLPARALSYAASALNFAAGLKKSSVNVDRLRIMSPCHANVYANGGNLDSQVDNAKKMRKIIQSYKENYLPELDDITVTLDTGNPITQNVEQYLLPRVSYVQHQYPDIADDISKVSWRYNVNGNADHLLDEYQRPLAYLLTHPPAWGYSEEEVLFDRNGDRRINFMPASELRYLKYMKRIEGKAWIPSRDKQIATVISAKQTHAPYHPLLKIGPWGNEPSIGDLAQEPSALQLFLNRLRHYSGRVEVAEVIANLNQLKSDQEQAVHRLKVLKLGPIMPFNQLISSL